MSDSISKSWFAVFNNPEEHGLTGTPEEICDTIMHCPSAQLLSKIGKATASKFLLLNAVIYVLFNLQFLYKWEVCVISNYCAVHTTYRCPMRYRCPKE